MHLTGAAGTDKEKQRPVLDKSGNSPGLDSHLQFYSTAAHTTEN